MNEKLKTGLIVAFVLLVLLVILIIFERNCIGCYPPEPRPPEPPAEILNQLSLILKGSNSTINAAILPNNLELKPGQTKYPYLGIYNNLNKDVEFCIACPNCNQKTCKGSNKTIQCEAYNPELNCTESIIIRGPSARDVSEGKTVVLKLSAYARSNADPNVYIIPIQVYGTDGVSVIDEVVDLNVTVEEIS